MSTERIYVELYGQKYVSQDRKITFYFDSYRPSHVHTTIPSVAGNGVVKVINGVLQSPATGIFDSDVDANANIQQSKIQGLTTSLDSLYPRTNPSGYITGVNLSSYVLKSETGSFVTTAQTGSFVTTGQTGTFASTINLASTGNNLVGQVNSLSGNSVLGNGAIKSIISLTQAQFDALSPPSPTALYLIIG